MFGQKRKNNDMNTPLMITLVGIGVGAAAYGMMRGRNNNGTMNDMMQPIQKMMSQMKD